MFIFVKVNIGLWNLQKLSEAIKPLLSKDKHQQIQTILQVNFMC